MILKDVIVIIPARGGSKRIPNKNIKTICGQPMIYWPLMELAKKFDPENILVSSDSTDIIGLVQAKGLRVPFRRPAELADDFTNTAKVVCHALNWYEKNVRPMKFVLTVYPTSVLLNIDDVIKSMDLLLADSECDTIMSATHFPYPIQRAMYKDHKGYAHMLEPNNYNKRSQDFQETLHDAGQFYLSRVETIRTCKFIENTNVIPYILSRHMVIDIDTEEDINVAIDRLKNIKKITSNVKWAFRK